jgi:hypothetical protein
MVARRWHLGLVALLSIGVAVVAPLAWLLGAYAELPDAPPLVAHLLDRYATERVVFLGHIVFGGIALLVGPFQLMPRLRARYPRLHRSTGYGYIFAVALAGSAGLVMGPTAWSGLVAAAGFTTLAIAWLGTTAVGLHRIIAGDRVGHRAWMTYSFALAFAAVSLRLQTPLLLALGVSDATAYSIVAWSSWLPNLVVPLLGRVQPKPGNQSLVDEVCRSTCRRA